ncbi:MAG: hypothetical protein IPM96_19470 [Ignavibacteria bacterium]|nr:hypothetical protein [Ignavibacteria bacterium]
MIVHNWHNKGYDSEYPDIFPPNPRYGGIDKLSEISNLCKSNNFLFSVHEMYSLIGSDNPNFENYKQYLTIGFDGNFVIGWNNPIMYKVKPSKMEKIFNDKNRGILINKKLNTTAGYLDVHSASDPSEYIDYDYKETGAGKFKYALRKNQEIADVSRKIHNGPVSGEGSSHFYYSGYYDDVEPQIVTASDFFSGDHIIGGYYQPVLVDFDLLKIKPLMFAHGMGYYERFFHKDRYWKHMGRSLDSALIYSATELAYGHGAFFSDLSYDIYEQSKLEYEYVYPVQLLYGNSSVKSILYNDNGNLITLSDYLRKYPKTYDKFNNQDFISQVFIEYENGVKIFVNRHPEKTWDIELTDLPGWSNYHGIINGSDKLYTGSQNPGRIILNKESGWICYSPVFPIIDN